jgi:hypothetical protein
LKMKIKKEHLWLVWILLSIPVLAADYATGPAIQFPIVFVIPVVLSSWYSGKIWGIVLALLLPIGRVLLHYVWEPSTSVQIVMVNVAIKIIVFAGIALLVDHAASLTREVRTLKGILPICSNCKKIRDEDGSWKQMETYISEQSEAKFSHGLCSECAEKLYPQYFGKLRG